MKLVEMKQQLFTTNLSTRSHFNLYISQTQTHIHTHLTVALRAVCHTG